MCLIVQFSPISNIFISCRLAYFAEVAVTYNFTDDDLQSAAKICVELT